MSEIIHDIFLSNYWDKRIGNAVLVGIDQINIWIQYFFHNKYKRGYYIRHRIEFFYQRPLKSDKIKFYIADRHNIVHDILLLGKGKISLCGGSIINILNSGTSYVHDYDLFFHCDSIEEANNILNMCMEYVTNLKVKQILYQRSQYIQTIEIIDVTRTWKIQFIRRIYKTKDQILLGFDLSGSRLGWNPQDGLFATICGAMAFAMKAFPIDLTQRSLSFGYRIDKYSKKGFDILLPGLINQNNIETPDGSLIYDEHHKFAFRCEKTKGSDYDDNICGNWYLINMGKYDNVTFSAEKLQDISKFPQEIINSSIKTEPLCELAINTSLIDPYKAQEFLGNEYKEFAKHYYVDFDFEAADVVWQKKWDFYIECSKDIVKNIKEHPWKSGDSGSQLFGKVNPIIANPREWYGKDYKPVVVGLSTERLQAFYDCRKNIEYMDMPDEIFKLLCTYWLKAEVNDARQRLFNLI